MPPATLDLAPMFERPVIRNLLPSSKEIIPWVTNYIHTTSEDLSETVNKDLIKAYAVLLELRWTYKLPNKLTKNVR